MEYSDWIIVRGAGDLASGTIHRLHRAGFPVLALETEHPAAIRRLVAFSEAVYDGSFSVEGVSARRIDSLTSLDSCRENGEVPLLVDPAGVSIARLKPRIVIDAILAKRNLGTLRSMAPVTIALGPGFYAGRDVDYVIETMRGHDLGRIITEGEALPNTGVPGMIAGHGADRVIHAPSEGVFHNLASIGDLVTKGAPVAFIEREGIKTAVPASLSGILRGLLRDGYRVTEGFKVADIDPRSSERKNCTTISDKARCIAGSVLEIVCDAAVFGGKQHGK